MICRLRLWVELLKNAYFLPGSDALETLPNINIKTGNSLVAHFPLQGKMKNAKQQAAFKKMTDTYRVDVMAYKHCKPREEKDELRRRLQLYKKEFTNFYDINDPVFKEFRKHQDLLLLKTS